MTSAAAAACLEQWRRDAYDYSTTSDRIGVVISRAMEVLLVVLKNGAGAENLKYAVDSLKWEREVAVDPDRDGEGTLRTHVYRLCEGLELTMDSVVERRGNASPTLPDPSPVAPSTSAAVMELPKAPVGFLEAEVKIEDTMDESAQLFNDHDVDIKEEIPDDDYDIFNGKSESIEDGSIYQESVEDKPSSSTASGSSRATTPAVREKRRTTDKGGQCDLCGARFVRARDLRRHLKTIDHSKVKHQVRKFNPNREREFKCDQCDAEFTRIDNLNRHKATHTGKARRIQCPHCNIFLSSNLNGHLREVHQIDPYNCTVCGETFGRVSQLKEHHSSCLWTPKAKREKLAP